MRKYEIMLIFDASLDEDAIEKELQKITSIIEKGNGSIIDSQKWGVRKLAYPIKHQENGYYHIINFSSSETVVNEIDRVNKINDKVLRHLIVKEEKNSRE
ncbi:MAG: 30S ribosomal protein S6 [Actinobacteria bacterium]|nr:30S ribosomal protein S6 [Cyanobacteriota bacterium]MCL5771223.1 30S ribosomal protein S6 [Actinomycetota bacterium]